LKYAWLVIGIVAARFLTTAIAYPQLDGDLAWQRRLGETILRTHAIPRALGDETFTAAGAPWLPQEWAFSVLGALAGNGPGFAVFAGGVAGAVADSLLGASIQSLRWCQQCARATERDPHACGSATRPLRGFTWFGNDAVNFSATIVGAGIAFAGAAIAGTTPSH